MRLRFLGVFLLGWILPSILVADSLTQDSIAYTWSILSIQDTKGNDLLDISLGDLMPIDDAGTFSFGVAKDSISETGKYALKGDSIYLSFERVPIATDIDSLIYTVEGNAPTMIFFKEGKEIARQDLEGIESKRRTEAYHISFNEDKHLVLRGQERVFTLGRDRLIRSSFHFMDIVRGMIGIIFLLFIAWLFSSNRKKIDWQLVISGLGLQLIFAILVLKVPFVNSMFSWISAGFVTFLDFTLAGSGFLFDSLVDVPKMGYIFAFQVVPVIIFFSAVTSVLYYLGILQKIVYGFAWIMSKTMKLSGAESLAAAGNIFLGQTEAPLLIRPYLPKMTRSEIMALMTGGMATIAGSVFGAYIGFLGGADPVQKQLFATHLLTASIMSAPAALLAAKMLVPETEKYISDLKVPKDKIGSNILDSIANGATEGLKLAVNVAIMLLVFLAIIKAVNYFLGDFIGSFTGLNDWVQSSTSGKFSAFGLEYIFGLVLAPVAWMMGVPADDIMVVGQLLGEKTVANEFVAYTSMGGMKNAGSITHYKSLIIATYALAGFSNFSSIGIQIGGIGALAPNKRKVLSELGVKALIGGTLAAFLTAVLAGMLINI